MADFFHIGMHGPHRAYDSVQLPPAVLGALTDASDRLVHRAFHVGLRLHVLGASLADAQTRPAEADITRKEVSEAVDEIDRLVHEAGLAILLLSTHSALLEEFGTCG